MLDSVVCLLQVQEAGTQRLLGESGCVDEVMQGKQVMSGDLPQSEACLKRAAHEPQTIQQAS